ncbi:Telomere_reg-2 domain-containing protein [Durusdinium trenchii]|uniref:Telomere_reg-2 domain-containing protein n=1 Tax=Durusdinium trenchii TaxID=1381693 RepID=A0ABP0SIR8_9DINO
MDNQRLVSGTRFGDLHPDTIGAQPEQKERENVEELQFKAEKGSAPHESGRDARDAVGQSRRFAAARRTRANAVNRFAGEALHFVRPLVARWMRPTPGAATWALSEPSVLAEFLRCLGVMLESAGRACAEKELLARDGIGPALEGLRHTEPLVRRCSLFLLSRVVLLGCEELVLEEPKILTHLEAYPFRESDETCRRMAAGLVACLSQHLLS